MTLIKCTKCKKMKKPSEFQVNKKYKRGYVSYCKECTNNIAKKYFKTEKGVIKQIYKSQIYSSKKRKHPEPEYTLNQLTKWIKSQPHWKKLYRNWKKSDYEKKLKPSIDRIDNDIHYKLDNIQLITFQENNKAMKNAWKKRKKVIQMDMEGNIIKIWQSAIACRRAGYNNISATINQKDGRKQAYGYKWNYKKEAEDLDV